jgi:hypothetical protein
VPTPVEHIATRRRKEAAKILKGQRKLDAAKRLLAEAVMRASDFGTFETCRLY